MAIPTFENLKDALPSVFRKGISFFERLRSGDDDLDFTAKSLTADSAAITDLAPVDKLGFNVTASNTLAQGEMGWNATEEVPEVKLNGATGQMFLEDYYHAKNETGSLITDGTPAMGAGVTDPDTILMTSMDGTDTNNAKWFLGLATHDFADDAEGKVTHFGKVRGIDTTGAASFGGLETWSQGDILYVDPDNVGYLTNVEPEPPAVYMPVALLLKKDAAEGVVHVRATSIDETALRTTRMSLDYSSPAPVRNAQESLFGNLDPITTAADVNAADVTLDATIGPFYGQGKMVIVNNGVAETGTITITGDTVDRNTGVVTLGDTEQIVIDATTTDNNGTDTNSQQVWDLEDAYITTKWFRGVNDIVISQDSGSLTDLDIYEVAFNQFGDARSINLRILDMTIQALGPTAVLSGHAYTVEVTGSKVNIQQIPDTELSIATGFKTDKWYRYKRQNFTKQLDGRTDGIFLNMSFLGTGSPQFANVTLNVWADIIP